jgi:hypothetical protein
MKKWTTMTTKEDLLRSFDEYVDEVGRAFGMVRDSLDSGDYDTAARLMTLISTKQGQMSVRVGASCIKLKERR